VSSNKGGSKFVSFGNGLTASSSNHYHAVFSTTVAVSAKRAGRASRSRSFRGVRSHQKYPKHAAGTRFR
jgi:hypothetical protein